jgi:hypothetical protein
MDNFKNKPEPKKIKMPPLVDRSVMYDTMSWKDDFVGHKNENNSENSSESISELESYETD